MAIYALGDLHLSFATDKPMDIFGPKWENYTEKINDNWLTPSMLRKYCTDRHDTIEKYLARMQSDERMKGMIKPVYSNKAKRDVLYLHDYILMVRFKLNIFLFKTLKIIV